MRPEFGFTPDFYAGSDARSSPNLGIDPAVDVRVRMVVALTGEYESDAFVHVVDETTVQGWIDKAVEELTRW